MADIIALESEAKTIGGSSSSITTNLCCTKARATALGCTISGTYTDKLLVCKKDLSPSTIYGYLSIIEDYYELYTIGDSDQSSISADWVSGDGSGTETLADIFNNSSRTYLGIENDEGEENAGDSVMYIIIGNASGRFYLHSKESSIPERVEEGNTIYIPLSTLQKYITSDSHYIEIVITDDSTSSKPI